MTADFDTYLSAPTRTLPDAFCWTKFGTEAGEPPAAIFERKELERHSNGGVFLWGIGQSIGPSLPHLLRATPAPEVLFSPMRASAAKRDVSPAQVVLWCDVAGFDGSRFELPAHSRVTSRMDPARPRPGHWALVCRSESPILAPEGEDQCLVLETLRNLRSGTPLGASQVTAIVCRTPVAAPARTEYPVAARARLVYPYLVRLTRAVPVPESCRADQVGQAAFESAMRVLMDGDALPASTGQEKAGQLRLPGVS